MSVQKNVKCWVLKKHPTFTAKKYYIIKILTLIIIKLLLSFPFWNLKSSHSRQLSKQCRWFTLSISMDRRTVTLYLSRNFYRKHGLCLYTKIFVADYREIISWCRLLCSHGWLESGYSKIFYIPFHTIFSNSCKHHSSFTQKYLNAYSAFS